MFDVFDIIGRDRSATRLRSQVPWNDSAADVLRKRNTNEKLRPVKPVLV
jgi:hypothetical protein